MEELLKQMMTELQGFRKEVNERFDAVDQRFDGVDQRLVQLEQGQIEIKDTIFRSATLMTENFTAICQEIREKIVDTQADVNLLFKEVESLKKTNL